MWGILCTILHLKYLWWQNVAIKKRYSTKFVIWLLTDPWNLVLKDGLFADWAKTRTNKKTNNNITSCSLLKDQGWDCNYRTFINWTRQSTEQLSGNGLINLTNYEITRFPKRSACRKKPLKRHKPVLAQG